MTSSEHLVAFEREENIQKIHKPGKRKKTKTTLPFSENVFILQANFHYLLHYNRHLFCATGNHTPQKGHTINISLQFLLKYIDDPHTRCVITRNRGCSILAPPPQEKVTYSAGRVNLNACRIERGERTVYLIQSEGICIWISVQR